MSEDSPKIINYDDASEFNQFEFRFFLKYLKIADPDFVDSIANPDITLTLRGCLVPCFEENGKISSYLRGVEFKKLGLSGIQTKVFFTIPKWDDILYMTTGFGFAGFYLCQFKDNPSNYPAGTVIDYYVLYDSPPDNQEVIEDYEMYNYLIDCYVDFPDPDDDYFSFAEL